MALWWVFLLWVLPASVLGVALWLTVWGTSALGRMTSWPWFVFAFVSIAMGAVMWWFMGIALLAAPALLAVGFVQMWRRRHVVVAARTT